MSDPDAARRMTGYHYQLCCYVCGNGCLKPSPFEGWASFTQIFQQRPDTCRYAVARIIPVFHNEPAGPFVCWDLYDDKLLSLTYRRYVVPPPPVWEGPTEDGVTMKAMMLYDEPSD